MLSEIFFNLSFLDLKTIGIMIVVLILVVLIYMSYKKNKKENKEENKEEDKKESFTDAEFKNSAGWWNNVINCEANGDNQLYCKPKDKWVFPY